MSRLLQIERIALLGALLLSVSTVYVEAVCGECYLSHSCISNTTFRLCYDGVPKVEHTFDCPDDKPVCTMFGDRCASKGTPSACGDISTCAQCDNSQMYACDSLHTFGICDRGVLLPERSTCPENSFCSVSGASIGLPCVFTCTPEDGNTCDRVDKNINIPPTTTTPTTTTPTTTTPTTPAPPTNGNAFCQNNKKAGRYAIPNDTVCTSFINCFFRANIWQGTLNTCPPANPYFNAVTLCGTVKPTTAGCK
ncbi:uncharacterized protein LOC6557068 [Drosophila grimshawi]|uniref:uncharacterized protein LOC6557068 n=1 Tax=Drosophila grimshawi TaxID=7222 RepID=UPI000C86EBB3|nr:uncharacterized protein LOC6557068 [Drosophila grimshawi]